LPRALETLTTKERHMPKVLTTTEARQGTSPRAMLWALVFSLILAIIAGLLLAVGWINLPWS
jgi:hypothetical protein